MGGVKPQLALTAALLVAALTGCDDKAASPAAPSAPTGYGSGVGDVEWVVGTKAGQIPPGRYGTIAPSGGAWCEVHTWADVNDNGDSGMTRVRPGGTGAVHLAEGYAVWLLGPCGWVKVS